jgi:1-acyl-sn-glycerol-3-phosphate acyltransferase
MSSPQFWFSQLRVLAALALVALPAATITIGLPRLRQRRRFARRAARLAFRIAGMPITIAGLDKFPDGPCVVVANHASYLDGVVLMAVLPPRFTFLIKSEMSAAPFIGLLLRRLGMSFVSRNDPKAAAGAATRLVRAARGGHAIGVFPEGTFCREPGLRDFRLGAFLAAARGNLPVIPLVIRGTRTILPAGNRLPRPRRIRVELLDTVETTLPGRRGAEWLRQTARRVILARYGEPDAAGGGSAQPRPLLSPDNENPHCGADQA